MANIKVTEEEQIIKVVKIEVTGEIDYNAAVKIGKILNEKLAKQDTKVILKTGDGEWTGTSALLHISEYIRT